MTGGRAVILGGTGRNFGAGMSGGIAYVYDTIGDFPSKVNPGMVELGRIELPEEQEEVKSLVARHQEYTGSEIAARVLDDWEHEVAKFHRVISPAYSRVLELQKEKQEREAVHG
jgi:glutamate synthase domain-containing protein 3